jgi:Fe-S oxidoreductase
MGAVVDPKQPLDTPLQTTEDCRYCWMCRHVCPVGHVTQRETLTPHGWALTIASVKRGALRWNEDSVGVLYACADCGLCRSHCVTDRPLPDAIAAARAEVASARLAPRVVYELEEKLRRWGNPYAPLSPRPSAGVQAVATAATSAVRSQDSHRGAAPHADAPARAEHAEIGLFVGDAARHLAPRELEAAQKLLAAAGITPVLIGDGQSSGLLASSLGLPDTAAELGRAIINEVAAAGCRELLVLAPGDRYAFERLYSDRLHLAWPAGIAITEVTTVLAGALANGRLAFERRANGAAATYAYHDPCHAPRINRDGAAPRALLHAALGESRARNLFWREHRAHPCGAIGGLELTQPAIAAKLADARLADTTAAGASWLITDDPACAHHLRSRPQNGVTVLGLYELLADQLASHAS